MLLVPAHVGAPRAAAAGEFVIIAPAGASPFAQRTVQQAAERCIPLYAGHLGVRLAGQIVIHLYPTRQAFVRGRITLGGEDPDDAQRTADYLGSAIGHNVLINLATHDRAAELTGTACHEIVHVYQYELGTEDARPAHEWILEGYAYFMEKIALDQFGLEPRAASRERAIRILKSRPIASRPSAIGGVVGALFRAAAASGMARIFPRLAEMATQPQFDAAGERMGSGFPHYLILMADYLLSQSSHAAFVAYFKSFAPGVGSALADENFRAAFGLTVEEFQVRVDAYITTLLRLTGTMGPTGGGLAVAPNRLRDHPIARGAACSFRASGLSSWGSPINAASPGASRRHSTAKARSWPSPIKATV